MWISSGPPSSERSFSHWSTCAPAGWREPQQIAVRRTLPRLFQLEILRGRAALPAGGTPALPIASHAESIIGVMKFGRDAGARGTPACLHVMPPGATAGRATPAPLWTRRIALRRNRVVAHLIPVAAPLMHVFADVIQAKSVRRVLPHRLRALLPPLFVVGQRLQRSVSPGIELVLDSATCRTLPLRLRR